MTEYLIIVALVAVVSIGTVSAVGTNLKVGLAKISNALIGSGQKVEGQVDKIDSVNKRNMNNFQEGVKNAK